MNPLFSENNIRNSVKKYFRDGLTGVAMTFDGGIESPPIDGAKSWLVFKFGSMDMTALPSVILLEIWCCTLSDPEGYNLAKLRDSVVEKLVREDVSKISVQKIPFYNTAEYPWIRIGSLTIDSFSESVGSIPAEGYKNKLILTKIITPYQA